MPVDGGTSGRRSRFWWGALTLIVIAGVVRVLIAVVPWSSLVPDFDATEHVMNEVARCLGFFDATRTMRIDAKMGDGSAEMVSMNILADQYRQLQRRSGLSSLGFGQAVVAGRKMAKDALTVDVLVARVESKPTVATWTREGKKCLKVEEQAKRRLAVEPDQPAKVTVRTGFDRLIDACACRGKLRGNYMNAEAQAAIQALMPLTDRATREIFEQCEAASENGRLAMAPLPAALVKSAGLLEECYALAATVR